MRYELLSCPHQSGELRYYLDDDDLAVLCDYTGNRKVLFLPSSVNHISDDGSVIKKQVRPFIPDESFGNCTEVEIIVCDYGVFFEFGCFTFQNCKNLDMVVYLEETDRVPFLDTLRLFNEYSFTWADYTSKPVQNIVLMLVAGSYLEPDNYYRIEREEYDDDESYNKGWEQSAPWRSFHSRQVDFYKWLLDCLPEMIQTRAVKPDVFREFARLYNEKTIVHEIAQYNKNSPDHQKEYCLWTSEILNLFE